jgi:hypothetical protein
MIDAVKEFQNVVFAIPSEQLTAIFPPVVDELLSNSKVLPPKVIVCPSVAPVSSVPPAEFAITVKSDVAETISPFLSDPVILEVRLRILFPPEAGLIVIVSKSVLSFIDCVSELNT